MRRVMLLVLVSMALGGAFQACSKRSRSKPAQEKVASPKSLPSITITRNRALVFTFRKGGEFRTVTSMDEIPLDARGWVRVQDPAVKAPISRFVYVADLRRANPQGQFPYRILTREQFLKGNALPGGMVPAGKGNTAAVGPVVLYSRPGCGACDSVRAYLTQRGVKFQEKNVQADPAAAKELAAKAAKKGFPTGVVPVIDVHGEIVVGLDVRKLERLLRRRI